MSRCHGHGDRLSRQHGRIVSAPDNIDANIAEIKCVAVVCETARKSSDKSLINQPDGSIREEMYQGIFYDRQTGASLYEVEAIGFHARKSDEVVRGGI